MKKKNTLKALKTVGTSVLLTVAATSAAFAEGEGPAWVPTALKTQGGKLNVESLVKLGLYLAIAAGVLWALFNIIRAGLEYSSAGDDAEKKKGATQRIISAVVGLIIVVLSFTILTIVSGWFGGGIGDAALGQPCKGVGANDDEWGIWEYVGAGGDEDGYTCVSVENGDSE